MLWVKGSGGDLGSMKRNGFATLYQEKLLALQKTYKGVDTEDDMVAMYPVCTFRNNLSLLRSIHRCTASCRSLMSITCIRTGASPSPLLPTARRRWTSSIVNSATGSSGFHGSAPALSWA